MSEQQTPKPKKTPEELAVINAMKICNSGVNVGKAMGKKESKDQRRKRLGVIVNTVAGRAEKGKTTNFKSIKASYNGVDDDRENYAKVKTLAEKVLLYLDSLPVPEKKPKGEQPNPEPTI